MQSQPSNPAWQTSPPSWRRFFKRHLPILLFLLLAIGGMSAVYWFFSPSPIDEQAVVVALEGSLSAPIFKAIPAKPVSQRLAQSPGPRRIGIISGHQGSDSGSVCDDGLTEAEINQNIANGVVARLAAQGIRTDLLQEFDPRLNEYSATALVSIHADSCTYVNDLATGFKVAGSSVTDSSQLSICIEENYARDTQLPYHENTITPHMTDYHAFRKIAPGTPAIIIEVGFINLDRALLTDGVDVISDALVKGIRCYLDSR